MCPVCRARFRGTAACSRCGADLTLIMQLEAEAWRLRQAARGAFRAGDASAAQSLAARAQRIRRTPAGRRLELLASLAAAWGLA